MAESFKLEILVPSGRVMECEVSSVLVPTARGEVGILPHHTRYTALLGTGVLNVQATDSAKSAKFVISGGFLNFADNALQILADSVDTVEGLKQSRYDGERGALADALKDVDTQTAAWASNRKKLDRIEAADLLLSQLGKGSLN